MHNSYNVGLLRAWVQRREAKGRVVTADELWNHIGRKWPNGEEWQREWLFNATPKGPRS